jgi:hypothetical protein
LFSDTQKDQIRQYLGFAAGYYQYNTPLESMMDKIGLSTVEQSSVETLLTAIAAIDVAIANTVTSGFVTGALKQVDKGDVEWYNFLESGGSEVLIPPKQRGKMLVGRLAKRFGYTVAELIDQGCAPWFFELSANRNEMALG